VVVVMNSWFIIEWDTWTRPWNHTEWRKTLWKWQWEKDVRTSNSQIGHT